MLQRAEMFGCDKSSCCWLKINPRDQRLWNYFDGQLNDLIHEDWQETGTGISPKTCVNTEEENLVIKVKESGDEVPEQRIISHLGCLGSFFFLSGFDFEFLPPSRARNKWGRRSLRGGEKRRQNTTLTYSVQAQQLSLSVTLCSAASTVQ